MARTNQAWRLLAYLFILALLCGSYLTGIEKVPYSGDESDWITTSQYWDAFISGRFPPHATMVHLGWGEHYWTLTQPPLARYLIGIGRSFGGFGVDGLNYEYNWQLSWDENLALGNVVQGKLLWWSRLPMAILAIGSGTILFYMVEQAFGLHAAVATILLFVANPYLKNTLRNAMGESGLLFFTLCSMALSYTGIKSWAAFHQKGISAEGGKRMGIPLFWMWFLLAGAAAGLAGATKINGLMTILSLMSICSLLPALSNNTYNQHQLKKAFLLAISTGCMALLIFILVNPFLYPYPLIRILKMYSFRLVEMGIQSNMFPSSTFPCLADRVLRIGQQVFESCATIRFSNAWLLNLTLTMVGLIALIQHTRPSHIQRNGALALLLVPLPLVLAALATPLDFERYYLVAEVYSTVCIACGAGWLLRKLSAWRLLWPKQLANPHPRT